MLELVQAGTRTRDHSQCSVVTALPLGHPDFILEHQEQKYEFLPIFVESSLGLLSNVFSPDSLESSHTSGSVNVADNSNGNHGRSLNDGDGLHDLFLVDLGAGSIHLPDDVGHTSLVAKEGSHVHWLGCIILGEGLALSLVALGTLLGQESFGSMTGCFKLSVRLKQNKY